MRRIVTGHNDNGKSIVTIDGPPARSIGEDVGGLFELWNTDGNAIITTDVIDRADDEIILSPPSGGTKFRYFKNHFIKQVFAPTIWTLWIYRIVFFYLF